MYRGEDQAEESEAEETKRVVALKGRPSFSPKVHVNTNLCASE